MIGTRTKKPAQILQLHLNFPNVITGSRIVLASAAVGLLAGGEEWGTQLAGVLIVAAWLTDGVDGFIARKLKQATPCGAIFDLVADRCLTLPLLVCSIAMGFWQSTAALMPFSPFPYALVIGGADVALLVAILVFVMKSRTRQIVFPLPTTVVRIAFPVQMLTLTSAILGIGPPIFLAALMYLSILFTLLAFGAYLRKGGYVFSS